MYKSIIKPGLMCYATPITSISANGTASPEIQFSPDSDFMLTEIRATKQAIGAILLTFGLSSGDQFTSNALDSEQFAGSNYPVRLPVPIRIPASTKLTFLFQNTTGGALSSQIQLWGFKVPIGE